MHEIADVIVDLHCLDLFAIATDDLFAQAPEWTERRAHVLVQLVFHVLLEHTKVHRFSDAGGRAEANACARLLRVEAVDGLFGRLLDLLDECLTLFGSEALAQIVEVRGHAVHGETSAFLACLQTLDTRGALVGGESGRGCRAETKRLAHLVAVDAAHVRLDVVVAFVVEGAALVFLWASLTRLEHRVASDFLQQHTNDIMTIVFCGECLTRELVQKSLDD